MVDPRRPWNPDEDPLPQEALDRVLDLIDLLPREFDAPGIDGTHRGKATVRLEFPGVADALTAAETAERMLQAVTIVETCVRNLVFARKLLRTLVDMGELLYAGDGTPGVGFEHGWHELTHAENEYLRDTIGGES